MGDHVQATNLTPDQLGAFLARLNDGHRLIWLDPKGRAYLSVRLDADTEAMRFSAASLPWPSGSAQPEADGYARKALEAWLSDMGIPEEETVHGIEQRSLSFRALMNPDAGLAALVKTAQPSQVWTFGLNLEA